MPAEERRRAAVLGHPVAHSLSPVLHRAAYADLGLDWTYEPIDVTVEALPGFVADLDGSWAGLSLTMPLKTAVVGLLDRVDPLVELTGAANTLVLEEGLRAGFNTDVIGILAALREVGAHQGTGALVLGGGATARSAVAALGELAVARTSVALRRPEASADLVSMAARLGLALEVVPWSAAPGLLGADIVVSTVPAGVADPLVSTVPTAPGVLLDVVYEPWPTPLAAAWQAAGGRVASGLAMLLHQAVAQVELMTGRRPDVELLRSALEAAARGR